MSWNSFSSPQTLLNTKLATLVSAGQIAWENVDFTPTPGTAYCRVYFLPASNMGKQLSGSEVLTGIYQVTVYAPRGQGAAPALVDTIKTGFPAGLTLRATNAGGYVRIERTMLDGKTIDGDRESFPLSINFKAYQEG